MRGVGLRSAFQADLLSVKTREGVAYFCGSSILAIVPAVPHPATIDGRAGVFVHFMGLPGGVFYACAAIDIENAINVDRRAQLERRREEIKAELEQEHVASAMGLGSHSRGRQAALMQDSYGMVDARAIADRELSAVEAELSRLPNP